MNNQLEMIRKKKRNSLMMMMRMMKMRTKI